MVDINISNFVTIGIIAIAVIVLYGFANKATGNKLPALAA